MTVKSKLDFAFLNYAELNFVYLHTKSIYKYTADYFMYKYIFADKYSPKCIPQRTSAVHERIKHYDAILS